MARWTANLFAACHDSRNSGVKITTESNTDPQSSDEPQLVPSLSTNDIDTSLQISPAETLDYYALTFGQLPTSTWSQLRDRSNEAVRKNRRQAAQILSSDNMSAFQHETHPHVGKSLADIEASHMARWIVHVLNTFPPRELINPVRVSEYSESEFESLSAGERETIIDGWTPRQRQFFENPIRDKPTPVELIDYYMCEFHNFSHTVWGELRGRKREAIRKNNWQAKKKFEKLHNHSYLDVSVDAFPTPPLTLTTETSE